MEWFPEQSSEGEEHTPVSGADFARVLGKNIRTKRKNAKLRQEDLALIAGISRQALIAIEKGDSDTKLATIARIAEALETTPQELLTPPPPPPPAPDVWRSRSSRVRYSRLW